MNSDTVNLIQLTFTGFKNHFYLEKLLLLEDIYWGRNKKMSFCVAT